MFGIFRRKNQADTTPERDINDLIRDIADHQRPADHDELLRRAPSLMWYMPVTVGSDQTFQDRESVRVTDDMQMRARFATVQGRNFVVLYTSRNHPDLGSQCAGIEGREAMAMALKMDGIHGVLFQSTGTGWAGIDRSSIKQLLGRKA